jgi:CRP/FNR family transcriptional regulator
MAEITETLATIPLFNDLPLKTLKRLERITRTRDFMAGEVIFHEGDEGVGMYVIVEGEVKVTRGEAQLATLGPGDFFGEMALLDHFRRSATITASKQTTCLSVSRWDLISELRENPDLAIAMLQHLSRRIRELDQRLEAM